MKEIEIACDISLVGGADFIKTSTGKNGIGATEDAVRVISNKIKEHYIRTNKYVGVKVSGGIRTVEQAKLFKGIVKNVLGEDWMNPLYFRIGASSLIKNIFS
jgi:deoxyribose-phosphate aldolase